MPNQLPSELNKPIAYSIDSSLGNSFRGDFMEQERWMWIKGYEDRYQISDYGRIRSFVYSTKIGKNNEGRILSFNKDRKGYYKVHLCCSGKDRLFLVSRLVAQVFILNPENKPQVNHIDGNRQNNHYSNLEWVTNSENQIHARDVLFKKIGAKKGIDNLNAKLNQFKVNQIREYFATGQYNCCQLAKIYRVNPGTIHNIINQVTWRD